MAARPPRPFAAAPRPAAPPPVPLPPVFPPGPVPPLRSVPPLPVAEPGGVRAEVALLRGEVRAVADQVRGLAAELRRQARTDWPALLTAGGLAVTVAVGLGALALDPLEAAADAARTRRRNCGPPSGRSPGRCGRTPPARTPPRTPG